MDGPSRINRLFLSTLLLNLLYGPGRDWKCNLQIFLRFFFIPFYEDISWIWICQQKEYCAKFLCTCTVANCSLAIRWRGNKLGLQILQVLNHFLNFFKTPFLPQTIGINFLSVMTSNNDPVKWTNRLSIEVVLFWHYFPTFTSTT